MSGLYWPKWVSHMKSLWAKFAWQSGQYKSNLLETTVYSDRPSIDYPPFLWHLSTKSNLFCIAQMIQLWHYSEIACSISINKIFFFIVIKAPKMGGWGNEEFLWLYSALWIELFSRGCVPGQPTQNVLSGFYSSWKRIIWMRVAASKNYLLQHPRFCSHQNRGDEMPQKKLQMVQLKIVNASSREPQWHLTCHFISPNIWPIDVLAYRTLTYFTQWQQYLLKINLQNITIKILTNGLKDSIAT